MRADYNNNSNNRQTSLVKGERWRVIITFAIASETMEQIRVYYRCLVTEWRGSLRDRERQMQRERERESEQHFKVLRVTLVIRVNPMDG